jgi:thiaminase
MESLKTSLYDGLKKLEAITDRFPIHEKSVYGDWLAQTYYFVDHSTRLLAIASSRFSAQRRDFHYRFAEHIKEERGHELLALNDLKRLGFSITDFSELPETKAFYQSQYYWVHERNPIAFFGYILCLEVFAIGGAVRMYDRVCENHGPETGVFLRVHTKEDVGHVDEAFRHLEKLSAEEFALIEENMALSLFQYEKMYLAMMKRATAAKTLLEVSP